jgi:tight adherence protein C
MTHTLAPLLAAVSLSWIAYFLVRNVRIEGTASRHLQDFRASAGPSKEARFGERMAGMLPISLESWREHLSWAQRGGFYRGQTMGNIVFTAFVYALGGLVILLIKPAPLFLLTPLLAGAYPFLALRRKANQVRRKVVRALPETASLVAAEVFSGVPPEGALTRAGGLPGPLSALIAEAVRHARQSGRPLFSRKPVRGALVETFHKSGLPQLRAFASQMDMIVHSGVDSASLMTDLARSLAREYHEQVMVEKEQLGGKITIRLAFFFFFPQVTILLMTFLIPMLQMF